MEILFLFIGVLIGGVIVWLYNKTKQKSSADITAFEQQHALLKADLEKLQKEYMDAERQKAGATAEASLLKESKSKLEEELTTERKEVLVLTGRISKANEAYTDQKIKIEELKLEKEEQAKKLLSEFENIANKILDEKSQKFTDQNKSNLDIILNPLKEKITAFEKKVDDSYKQEAAERNSLKGEILKLTELNAKISLDANNLTKALKGDNKMQGNWGEKILEKILESSGLLKNIMFKTQVTLTNNAGEDIRPDAIVYLPENKHIIIDAKVSLVAYQNFVSAEEDVFVERFMKEHIASIRSHVKLLSDKNYYSSNELNAPEFVLMFIPIESSFGMAVQADVEIFNYAWDKKIIIVSPSTLQATLLTIASIWRQENQTKNAMLIAQEGGKLYDKFVGFTEDLEKIGRNLDQSKSAYDAAFNKLRDGKGSIFSKVQNLKELGAKTTKALPDKLFDNENEASEPENNEA